MKLQKKIKDTKTDHKVKLRYVNTAYWKDKDKKFIEFLNNNKIDSVPIFIEYKDNKEIRRGTELDFILSDVYKHYKK